jgi:hypothetical protein
MEDLGEWLRATVECKDKDLEYVLVEISFFD